MSREVFTVVFGSSAPEGLKTRKTAEKYVKFEGNWLFGRVADYTGLGAVWCK